MTTFKNRMILIGALAANRRMIRVKPSINWFLMKYMRKFNMVNVDGQLIIHSHLPPLNSKAYSRFVREHLLDRTEGPSHAQVSVTNLCPQNCAFCYNKNRSGDLLSTAEIIRSIRELKEMGVFWLGLTGGEPLMNKDLVEIVRSAGDDCAIKLFTTGSGLTEELARDLKKAGLLYVSISLDHWMEEEHDRNRGCQGAFRSALQAIELFKNIGIHVSVSAVISKEMMKGDHIQQFLGFLIGLGVHEAWLSETKPTIETFRDESLVITEEERLSLVELQDRYNKGTSITVNYLGHFEGKEHFGCNAGNKMVYIDAFGEVSPCVFIPMTFGNIRDRSLQAIFKEMKEKFPAEGCCFINKNYDLLQKYSKGRSLIGKEDAIEMVEEVRFSPPAEFTRLLNKH